MDVDTTGSPGADDLRFHDSSELAAGEAAGWNHDPRTPKPENPYRDARGRIRWEEGYSLGVQAKLAYLELRASKVAREAEAERKAQARWKRSGRYRDDPE